MKTAATAAAITAPTSLGAPLVRPREVRFHRRRLPAEGAQLAGRGLAEDDARDRGGLRFDLELALAAIAPRREHEAVLTLQRGDEILARRRGSRAPVAIRQRPL